MWVDFSIISPPSYSSIRAFTLPKFISIPTLWSNASKMRLTPLAISVTRF